MEASAVVLYQEYFAIDRKPVGVYIKHGHEHRQLYDIAFEIFRFVDFFEGHHGAVDRRYHHTVAVAAEMTARRAEEVEYKQEKHCRYGRENNRNRHRRDEHPRRNVDYYKHTEEYDQYVCAFSMYFYSHQCDGYINFNVVAKLMLFD